MDDVSVDEEGVDQEEVIACLLSERDLAIRGEAIARNLFAHAASTEELGDGYGFRFDDGDAWLDQILAFVAAERRCCPFLTFEVAFEPYGGPVWLRLRGSPRIKRFVAETFTNRVGAESAGAHLA